MNHTLWKAIQDFDLDQPLSEYGFTTRLSHENEWPLYFAQKAILEYKKFMYLAATAEGMVSPSEIVDIVWHQHLIFTQSYNAFCDVLGKKVDHIPSTHNQQEWEKFKLAKERTKKLYEAAFGEQPTDVWNIASIYEPLQLAKSGIKMRTLLLLGVLVLIGITLPAYHLLKDVYVTIDNPYFIIGYLVVIIVTFTGLELWNRKLLQGLISSWSKSAFVFHLSPLELVYLQAGKLDNVVHGCVNHLLEEKRISIGKDNKLFAKQWMEGTTPREMVLIETIKKVKGIHYSALLKQVIHRPAFSQVARTMNAFKQYVKRSQYITRLFAINFILLSVVLLLGMVRVGTGWVREKPVDLLVLLLVVYLGVMGWYLFRITNLLTTTLIPQMYKKEILPDAVNTTSWEWSYFLLGYGVLNTALLPVISYAERHRTNNDNGASSCSTSCASSCGSSCGGCGGD